MSRDDLTDRPDDDLEHDLAPDEREAPEAHATSAPGCDELLPTAPTGGELTCQELADFLHEYVDGSLPPERREVFDGHLGMCPPCVAFLESYKRTIELTCEACGPCDDEAPEVPDGLVRAILAARARELDE